MDDPFRYNLAIQRITSLFGVSVDESDSLVKVFPILKFPYSAVYPTIPTWKRPKDFKDHSKFVEPNLTTDFHSLREVFL